MAEESSAFETLTRKVTQEFNVLGGRVFAHHAEPGKLNNQTIELKCEGDGNWLFGGTSVVIGTDKHPRLPVFSDDDDVGEEDGKPVEDEEGWQLNSIPTMVSLYQVDEAWLAESAERNEGTPILGQFVYHEAIQTADGVVNEKWPRAHAWVGVGPETFQLVRERLLAFQKFDFSVGLEILFPEGTVESGWVGRNVKWDGKGQLRITGATIVWKREDWSADFRHKERPRSRQEVEPYEPPREHVEVMDAVRRVERAVARLTTPLWITAAAIIGFLIFGR